MFYLCSHFMTEKATENRTSRTPNQIDSCIAYNVVHIEQSLKLDDRSLVLGHPLRVANSTGTSIKLCRTNGSVPGRAYVPAAAGINICLHYFILLIKK